ncbi:hypothetical protein [Wohlfahrtiimonas populi]|uniref:hypothetical protein n=1 Tax=Wohlfahrtiimonas populi TaxID=1940240 RepID=UPI00098D5FF4|nr:hypothetical protein [Wohlfahrtiimonas populi]
MDKLFEILKDFFQNPTMATFIILFVCLLFYSLHRLRPIEEYLNYRSLKRYEQYINAATDHGLKKLLNKRRDQEVLFKLTKIHRSDLSMKIMKLLTHDSIVLYRRDLNYYRFKFDLIENKICIQPLSFFDKLGYKFLKLLALCCSLFAFFVFILLLLKLMLRDYINIRLSPRDDMGSIVELIVYMVVIFCFGLYFLTQTPKSNEKEMNELLEKFNNSENN